MNCIIRPLAVCIVWLQFTLAAAQNPEIPEVIPPSPTVANLMKFEEVPVSYYTGQPNIRIPITSKALNSAMSMNIGLSYNTQGIKIDSRSGWTGTGWSLTAGGSISRTVRDYPDEAKKSERGFTTQTGIYHNSDYWNYSTLSSSQKEEFQWKAIGTSINTYDHNPDLYQFSFMGFSGRFVVLKQGTTLVPKLISTNGKFDIDINYNASTYEINYFTVTDPNGYKYTFNTYETTTATNSSGVIQQGGGPGTSLSQTTYNYRSAWQLTSIKTSNDVVLATLSYANSDEDYEVSHTYTTHTAYNTPGNFNTLVQNPYNAQVMEPERVISDYDVEIVTKKLTKIAFKDGTWIDFTRTADHTHPETNGSYLTNMVMMYKLNGSNTEQKRYTLSYETAAGRLWLMKVRETDGSVNLDTEMMYEDKVDLPSYGSDNEKGPWGYYSDIETTGTFDPNQIQTGLLVSIQYPTGGVKEFNFEHNAFSYVQNQSLSASEYNQNPMNTGGVTRKEMIGGGVRIKSIAFKKSSLDLTPEKEIFYVYNDEIDSDKSSGTIDALEDRMRKTYDIGITRKLYNSDQTNCTYFPNDILIRYHVVSEGMNAELTQGEYVGYRHVRVLETGNGYQLFDYTSPYDYPSTSSTFILPNSRPKENNDYKRGLLLKHRIFNESGQILQEQSMTYSFTETFLFNTLAFYKTEDGISQFFDKWANYDANVVDKNDACSISFLSNPISLQPYTVAFNSGWAKLTDQSTKEYLYKSGTPTIVEKTQDFTYNSGNFQVASETLTYKRGGLDQVYTTQYTYSYPVLLGGVGNTSQAVLTKMANLNIVNAVLEKNVSLNGTPISQTWTNYNEFHTNLILPSSVEVSKGGSGSPVAHNTPEERIVFHNYDTHGNLTEVSKKDGAHTYYIWGYNQSYPVAKIDNATHSQVSSRISAVQSDSNLDDDYCLDSGSCAEQNLRAELASLRGLLTAAHTTTYTYDPAFGLTSQTDPKGYTTYYRYDGLGRLIRVLDSNGDVLSENEYHYEGQ